MLRFLVHVPTVQWGYVAKVPSFESFPIAYSSYPTVMMTPTGATTTCVVLNISPSGFTYKAVGGNETAKTGRWLAIGH